MLGPKDGNRGASRRIFLKQMRWAPVFFLPAPIHNSFFRSVPLETPAAQASHFPFTEVLLSRHYPAASPLDDVLQLATPGTDEYVTEAYAVQLMELLEDWSRHLKVDPPATAVLSKFVASSVQSTELRAVRESHLRPDDQIDVLRREFGSGLLSGRERFLEEIKNYLAPLKRVKTADFEIWVKVTSWREKPERRSRSFKSSSN
jgi:hypothetical protein